MRSTRAMSTAPRARRRRPRSARPRSPAEEWDRRLRRHRAAPPGPAPAPAAPPVAQPAAAQSAVQPAALPPGGPGQAVLAPIAGYTIMAARALWPALQVLQALQHSWTL